MVTTFPGKQGGTSDMMDSYVGMCPCETVSYGILGIIEKWGFGLN